MTPAEWQILFDQLLARHWNDYMAYDEEGQGGVAACIKNGYRDVRDALRDLSLSDDDAAVYREAIARLKTGSSQQGNVKSHRKRRPHPHLYRANSAIPL